MNPQDYTYWENRSLEEMKSDWGGETYEQSISHPHRKLILRMLDLFEPLKEGILEVGCNTGPNLLRIREKYPKIHLAGTDANKEAIEKAKELLPRRAIFIHDSSPYLFFNDKSFDVVIADAVLMYIKDVRTTLEEMKRVARKGIILVDWWTDKDEEIIDYHWARNYPKILSEMGFGVTAKKLTEEDWPNSTKWQKQGYIFTAALA